ncbi:isoflavone reductase family protein [Xylogone sp. PMI_703]|nr:isoflavone reductase family protein [Xylogone sp. PMI_703]
MAQEIKNVILIGASGNLGSHTLKALLSSPFNVSVLSHPDSKATFPPNVTVHRTEYTVEKLVPIFKGQDAVVSTIGTFQIGLQKAIVDAAVQAGVKRFIPSEYGCDTNSSRVLEIAPILKGKADIAAYLKEKTSSGITWTAIITGPFFDMQPSVKGFLGLDLATHTATVWDHGNERFVATTLPQIARAIVGVLSHPAETANKYIYVSSFNLTQNELVATAEKITGHKWSRVDWKSEEKIKTGLDGLAKGDFSVVSLLLRAATFTKEGTGNFEAKYGLSNELLGLPKENLEEILSELFKNEKV